MAILNRLHRASDAGAIGATLAQINHLGKFFNKIEGRLNGRYVCMYCLRKGALSNTEQDSHGVCPGCIKKHYPDVYDKFVEQGEDLNKNWRVK